MDQSLEQSKIEYGPIRCIKCVFSNDVFDSWDDLEAHLIGEHFKQILIFSCNMCKHAKFPTEATLYQHYDTIHKKRKGIQINYMLNREIVEERNRVRECLKSCMILNLKLEVAKATRTTIFGEDATPDQTGTDQTKENQQKEPSIPTAVEPVDEEVNKAQDVPEDQNELSNEDQNELSNEDEPEIEICSDDKICENEPEDQDETNVQEEIKNICDSGAEILEEIDENESGNQNDSGAEVLNNNYRAIFDMSRISTLEAQYFTEWPMEIEKARKASPVVGSSKRAGAKRKSTPRSSKKRKQRKIEN